MCWVMWLIVTGWACVRKWGEERFEMEREKLQLCTTFNNNSCVMYDIYVVSVNNNVQRPINVSK